jgi:GNAT superfamily N-acetyltransferase
MNTNSGSPPPLQYNISERYVASISENLPYEEILDLLHESFREYLKDNIIFTVSKFTVDILKKKLVGATVVIINHNDQIVGFSALYPRFRLNRMYANGELVAVSPHYRHQGIAKLMLKRRIKIAKSIGCLWLEEDTAVTAHQSVKWHLSAGFKIVGLESYASTAYYSYVFKYYFDGKQHRFMSNVMYYSSYIVCKTCKRANGSLTRVGSIIKRCINQCKN